MTQKELVDLLLKEDNILKTELIDTNKNRVIKDITFDSRKCVQNSVFFAKGKNFKKEYLADAVKSGAFIVISEQSFEDIDIGKIVVKDINTAMSVVADMFFGQAYNNLKLIGITGTKGKSTTAFYLRNILDEFKNKKIGFLSTVEIYTGITDEPSELTTPEAIDLHRYFMETKNSDLEYMVMEVSSQAYKVKRVKGVKFNTGVFLNVSEDHISENEHPNFNDYLNCKLELIKNSKNVIINRETDCYEQVLESAKNAEKIITFGSEEVKDEVDYYTDNIKREEEYMYFDVHGKNYEKTFKTKMHGKFNAYNALAAIAVAKMYGVDDISIEKGIQKTTVEGRMNIFEKDGVTVIVDYAHNLLSYTKFFESIKEDYKGRRIITVAGESGEKAFNRRKDLGVVAGTASSYMYLTAEDPQFEDVESICKEIASYVQCPYEIVTDRKEAVIKAIKEARPGDVIAILGKGEEKYQKIKGKAVPYDSDTELAKMMTM